MKKELSALERNIVKGIAIALSIPVLLGIARGNSKAQYGLPSDPNLQVGSNIKT